MKQSTNNKQLKTRRGSTSFFIAGFMILILAVFMIGFSRLMISESRQTSNNDLSQSAYDSALAGIEDAKIALLKYHQCINDGATRNNCPDIIREMENGIANKDCDTVKKALSRTANSEHATVIQETQTISADGNVAKDMEQAYTCVTIEEKLGDYLTTMGSDSRTRIIPIRTKYLNDIHHIDINWFSTSNATSVGRTTFSYNNNAFLYPLTNAKTINNPPLLGVSLFQADSTFNLSQLSMASASNQTDRATVYLKPTSLGLSSTNNNTITGDMLSLSADKNKNEVTQVSCATNRSGAGSNGGYYCSAHINIPKTWSGSDTRNPGASFLLLTLPYGTPTTDVQAILRKSDGSSIDFVNVQADIDATGRANTLYRRLEARVELVDVFFPYPEFTIQLNDNNENVTRKTFYVTNNCWHSGYNDDGSLNYGTCNNFNVDNSYASF